MTDRDHLYYLTVANKYIGGPLAEKLTDKSSLHLVEAVTSVLARVIAKEQLQARKRERWQCFFEAHKDILQTLASVDIKISTLIARLKEHLDDDSENSLPLIESGFAELAGCLSSVANDQSEEIFSKLIAVETQVRQEVETRVQQVLAERLQQTDSSTRGNQLSDPEQEVLLNLLRRECGESADLAITNIQFNLGGYSKATAFVSLTGNSVLPDEIVLRYDLAASPLGTTVRSEYALIETLFANGIKVPKPLAADLKGEVFGDPLIVLAKVPGETIGSGIALYETENRENCALDLARELAKLHGLPVAVLPDNVRGKELTPAEMVDTELAELRQIWEELNVTSVIVEGAFGWLAAHRHFVGTDRSLVHGDARFHNVLVGKDSVNAILDWETVMVNNPAMDLSHAYDQVIQLTSWDRFRQAYAEAGGKAPDDNNLRFFLVRTGLFAVVYLTKIKTDFLSGAFENISNANAGFTLGEHCEAKLSAWLDAVLKGEAL